MFSDRFFCVESVLGRCALAENRGDTVEGLNGSAFGDGMDWIDFVFNWNDRVVFYSNSGPVPLAMLGVGDDFVVGG